MRAHVIAVSPRIRSNGMKYFERAESEREGTKHPNAFDARLAGSDEVLCVSETPLLDAARTLLAAGIAQPDDTIVMRHEQSEYSRSERNERARHVGSDVDALCGRVGVLAGLTIGEPKGKGRLRLMKVRDLTAWE